LLVALYAVGAISFCSELSPGFRKVLSIFAFIGILPPFIFSNTRKRGFLFASPVLLIVYGWYFSLEPKMDAPWSKDVAVLPSAEIQGDIVTVKNIRNFNYRSDADFDVAYYDKVYDLSKLKTTDVFLSYWGTSSIAHTIMSFGFENGDQLAVSIETRKEVGEEYSAVQGFFNKFERIYVLADERDVIGVRVNHRNEDVYLYRLRPGPEESRKILMGFMNTVNDIRAKPQFYNALTKNCTTSFLPYINAVYSLKFNWAMIANGYLDRWRYDEGVWGFELPFEEFRKQSHINEKVKAAGNSLEFSSQIRDGLPSIKYIESHRAEPK
jgi:hypothetical protein